MTINYAPKAILVDEFPARYQELCAERDRINDVNAPLEAQLADVVAKAEALRVEAEKLSAQIDDNRGREKWIAMKREIRQLAKALSGAK